MPQKGKKFAFTLHSYQSHPDHDPDVVIKLGEKNNDNLWKTVRARRWKRLLIAALQAASLARAYTAYAHANELPEDLLARYFFFAPVDDLGFHGVGLRAAQLKEVKAKIACLHLALQDPLEILGTGKYFHDITSLMHDSLGYVKFEGVDVKKRGEDGVRTKTKTTRKIHVRLDQRTIVNHDANAGFLARCFVHEASHKYCNTRDRFYDFALEQLNLDRHIRKIMERGTKNPEQVQEEVRLTRVASLEDELQNRKSIEEKILKMVLAVNNADSYARFICDFGTHGNFDDITAPQAAWLHLDALQALVEATPDMIDTETVYAEGAMGMQVHCTVTT